MMQAISAAASDPTQTGTSDPSSTLGGSTSQLTKESTFLELLVAQIKNQNPLNPTDSIQFVSQLVQFSELEQLLGINQGVQTLAGKSSTPVTPPASGDGTQTNSIKEQ